MLSVFTREWLDADVAIVDGAIAGLGAYDGQGDARRVGKLRRAGLHRRAHAPRVGEADGRRVRAPRAAARDDGGRRRPARDRERPRRGRRALAARRELGAPARRLLHGALVRSGISVRVAAPTAHAGRPRVADASTPGARARRDDELPRRRRRLAGRAREARARRRATRGRACARAAGARASGLRGCRHLLRPRGADGRGGARTAARGHVAPDPRGFDGAQPASAPAARRGVRAVAHRVLHGRSRSGGHRGLGTRERDGSRGRRGGYRSRGRSADGLASPRALARPRATRRARSRLRRGSPRPARPRELPTVDGAEAREPDRGRATRRDPRLGAPVGACRAAHAAGLRDPVGRRRRACDRPDRGSGRDRVVEE